MGRNNTLLVIARKYNDIFYAVSTPEWRQFDRRILVIFTERQSIEGYPLLTLFDDVIRLSCSGVRFGNLLLLWRIKALKKRVRCAAVMMSNMVLVANQYLAKISAGKRMILLEDGLMNYYDFQPSESKTKRCVQYFLGINERKVFDAISHTYLLAPELACYYGGNPEPLKLDAGVIAANTQLEDIEGKTIFVGQCLYRFGNMTIETYSKLVNDIIKKYHIDYYLPHAFALCGEKIDCPILDLGRSRATLEFFSTQYNFTVYSFCSSVLYSTRIINPAVRSYLIRLPELRDKSELPVIKKYCTGVIDF